jgi:hypothetical protein
MSLLRYTIVACVTMSCFSSFGAQVTYVAPQKTMFLFEQEPDENLDTGDFVCVLTRRREAAACGKVSTVSLRTGIVELKFVERPIKKGDLIQSISQEAEPSRTVNNIQKPDSDDVIEIHRMLFRGHCSDPENCLYVPPEQPVENGYYLGAGVQYQSPFLALEHAPFKEMSLGLQLQYVPYNSSAHLTNTGIVGSMGAVFLTIHYFPEGDFRKLFFQWSAGLGKGEIIYKGQKAVSNAYTTLASIGYRWGGKSLLFGASTGFSFTHIPAADLQKFNLRVFTPFVQFEVGYLF